MKIIIKISLIIFTLSITPFLIHFLYFLILPDNYHPLHFINYLPESSFSMNTKYKSYLFYNIKELINFITIYYILLLTISFYSYRKKFNSLNYKIFRSYVVASSILFFTVSFIISDTKHYYYVENEMLKTNKVINEKFEAIRLRNAKFEKFNKEKIKNGKDLYNLILTNTVNAAFENFMMESLTYKDLSIKFILEFNKNIKMTTLKIDTISRDNGHENSLLPNYVDIILLANVPVILIIIFSNIYCNNKNNKIKFIIYTMVIFNMLLMINLLIINSNAVDNVSISNNNSLKLYLIDINEFNFKNKVEFAFIMFNNIFALKYVIFKKQITLLFFSFILLHQEIIKKIINLDKKNKIKFNSIMFILSILFAIQLLLISILNIYMLFPVILYLIFFLRDSININKINSIIILIFILFFITEIYCLIMEYFNILLINNSFNDFIINPQRSQEFLDNKEIKILYSSIMQNEDFGDYYSKTMTILFSIAAYFFLKNHHLFKNKL